METNQTGFTEYTISSEIDEHTIFPNLERQQYSNLENGLGFNFPSPDLSFLNVPFHFDMPESNLGDSGLFFALSPGGESYVPTSSSPSTDAPQWTPEGKGSSPSEESLSSEPVLKFISEMLMEENIENQPIMSENPLALQKAEQSLFDILVEVDNNPSVDLSHGLALESPSNILGDGSDYGGNSCADTSITSSSTSNMEYPQWVNDDVGESNASKLQTRVEYQFEANTHRAWQNPGSNDGLSVDELVQNFFSDSASISLFQRGLEEASKFLPSANQLGLGLHSNTFASARKEEVLTSYEVERQSSVLSLSDNKKNYHKRNELEIEDARSNKQSAVYDDEDEDAELSELFDKVLLSVEPKGGPMCCITKTESEEQNEQSNDGTGKKTRGRRQQGKKKETIDLRTLLILCAQAVSVNDFRTANELIKQVREHASSIGDGTQRLAHYFANGLEGRLRGNLGTGVQSFFTSLTLKRSTAADLLKSYKTSLQSCPYKKFSMFFSNKTILHASVTASTLHIVDFGVAYGFQWPLLIQYLSDRQGGPPKLRFTGIELPQRGFRPAERIEETGRRLKKYCDRFNVPFEYNPIVSQNWENIPIEDLKIQSGEFLAVNCLYRFKNLLDEATNGDCQRDAVLKLIRKMNPNIFVHTIINGSYSSPFFVTRFREALFYFSSVFDMLDCILPRDNTERFFLESEFYGRDAMNAAACEGLERVDRPETYKQWQYRTIRAGFKIRPLERDLIAKFMGKVKEWYHKDFVMDVDNEWMLQGWKGRIMYASSAWVPA